ncbi:unnamed protein product [Prorocentrum cordatum]|uniref:Anaphase-promoting complex subunit 11 n=1 Tax=Prorocentrum cordatum TaxID=2364126 RepID=A0ABN9TQU4_9DINO|nr:unnamed protein product [Polarella glacialis]
MAEELAAALGVSPDVAAAVLEEHGGDVHAAAEELMASACGEMEVEPREPARRPGALGVLVDDMGYGAADAERALAAAGGDLEGALSLLFDEGAAAPAEDAAPQACAAPEAACGAGVEEEFGDCAICCERLRPNDAAMRCAGRGGACHYGHAACLARWVEQCRSQGQQPSCPTCRGALQMNRRNLRDFLRQAPSPGSAPSGRRGHRGHLRRGRGEGRRRGGVAAAGSRERDPVGAGRDRPLSSEHSSILESMLEQVDDDDCEWSEVNWGAVAGTVLGAAAVGAVAIGIGLLAKSVFDDMSKRRRR